MASSSAPSTSGQTPTLNDNELLEEYFRGELDTICATATQAIRSGRQEALQEALRSSLEKLNVLYIKVTNAHGGETIRIGAKVIRLDKALRRSTKVVAFA